MDVSDLPALNASLNAIAAVLLFAGRSAIVGKGDRSRHRTLMVCALGVSALFLCSYLYYHAHVGHTVYTGQGVMRVLYFTILATHVPLAGLMVPFILAAVWFAFRGKFEKHRRLVRVVWPVWMYVSVTGVLIYVMLYLLPR